MLNWDKVTMAIFKYDDSTESMTADLNFFKGIWSHFLRKPEAPVRNT